MAKVWNPWFKDLPLSYQTEENKYLKISSESVNAAELILKNGAADTRLDQLVRDREELLARSRIMTSSLEELNVIAWTRKRKNESQSAVQTAFRAVRMLQNQRKKLGEEIDHLSGIIYYLRDKLKDAHPGFQTASGANFLKRKAVTFDLDV